jgi:hypothetical protein
MSLISCLAFLAFCRGLYVGPNVNNYNIGITRDVDHWYRSRLHFGTVFTRWAAAVLLYGPTARIRVESDR